MKKIRNLVSCIVVSSMIFQGVVPTVTKAAESYFSENFENGSSKWTTRKGNWTIKSDESKVYNQSDIKKEAIATRGDKDWTDYTVEADIKVEDFNGSNRAMLCSRYKDHNNYYAVSLSSKSGGTVELRKKVNGKSTTIKKVSTSIKANKLYNVKLEVKGSNIKVYIDDKVIIESKDTSLTKGAVALLSSKVNVSYDNVVVTGDTDSSNDGGSVDSGNGSTSDKPTTDSGESTTDPGTSVTELSSYSLTGFGGENKGGGVIDESSPYYKKVTNATELGQALKRKSTIKVIEIANDIDLGWNVIPDSAKVAPFKENAKAQTHPTLKKTGVSEIQVDGFDGLTIYSKNGAKLTHGGITIKRSKNVVIRNMEFDELWEWDEATKGNYDKNDWDYLTLEKCNNVWIDHCTFGKAYDGVVDSKKGTTGLTISWSKFLSGDANPEFMEAMFDELEANKSKYPMYSAIRSKGLSKEEVMKVASPQKKTHLVGATEMASDNDDLEITLHHNYYKDSQDRMPRLRGGNAHVYNIVMDSENAENLKKLIPDKISDELKSKGYKFTITSNGAISTENGAVLVEKSQILGVKSPIRNNQKDSSKSEYTGKIEAVDTIYKYGDISFRGDSTEKDSPLSPEPAKAKEFSWNNMSSLPYKYKMDDPSTLKEKLTGKGGAGAGQLNLSNENWMKTKY